MPKSENNLAEYSTIDEKAAKALLVEAFLADVLSSVSSTELSTEIMSLYRERHGW